MGHEGDWFLVLPSMHLFPNLPRWQRQSYPRPFGRLMQVASGPQASVGVQVTEGYKQRPFLLFTGIMLPCLSGQVEIHMYLSDSAGMSGAGSCCQWILGGSCTYTNWPLSLRICHHSELHEINVLNIMKLNTGQSLQIHQVDRCNWPGMGDLCRWDSLWHQWSCGQGLWRWLPHPGWPVDGYSLYSTNIHQGQVITHRKHFLHTIRLL